MDKLPKFGNFSPFNQIQWKLVEKNVFISGVLITGFHCRYKSTQDKVVCGFSALNARKAKSLSVRNELYSLRKIANRSLS